MAFVPVRRSNPTPAPSTPEIVARIRTRRQPPPSADNGAPAPVPKPNYDVGYKRPPEHTRFKPGQSGNPRGRPKGAKGLKTIVRDILTAKVTVRTAQGPKKMTKIQALLAKTTELAFSGNLRAQQLLIQFYAQSVPESVAAPVASPASPPPDAHDLAILEELRGVLRAELEQQP